MASNAERQAAWRARHKDRLQQARHAFQEVLRGNGQPLPDIGLSATTQQLRREIEEMCAREQALQGEIAELRKLVKARPAEESVEEIRARHVTAIEAQHPDRRKRGALYPSRETQIDRGAELVALMDALDLTITDIVAALKRVPGRYTSIQLTRRRAGAA